jgi:hypothetical protein
MRKLLPYERALIDALQISEEEYWQFYLARLNYRDEKQGTILDVRMGTGAEWALAAAIISIVGTVAQVAATLLAPKPEVPGDKMGRQSRNPFFAPRYGFNSLQEVARYGEPVNLIYTNADENKLAGGLRVNTSLVWSAVHSFGTSQYMQMLTVIGAGPIQSFDYGRTAFGQTPLRDLASQRYFLYANEDQSRLFFKDRKLPTDVRAEDDPVYTTGNADLCTVITNGQNRTQGYSQAFSPTTSSSLGLYDVVPLRVQVEDRDDEGNLKQDSLGINVPQSVLNGFPVQGRGIYWPNTWPTTGVRPALPKGSLLFVVFSEDDNKPTDQVERAAIDLRSAYINTFDPASTYKIGAAKFKLRADNIQNGSDIEGTFVFECVESGVLCEEDYGTRRYQENEQDLRRQKREAENTISTLNTEKSAAFAERFKGPGADKIAAFDAELEEIDNAIESATAILKGNLTGSELLNVIKEEGVFKGIRLAIDQLENDIKSANDKIDAAENTIGTIRDTPAGSRTNAQKRQLQDAKEEKAKQIAVKRAKKGELKDQYSRLTTRAIEQGLYDGAKNTDLREERKKLKARRRNLTKRRAEVASNVERDSSAENAAQSAWTASYNAAVANLNNIVAQLKDEDSWNDYFNTKCIAKIDEIRYECITKCEVVNFAFKAKVFQRIQGRMNKYAEEDQQGHKDSDNGIRNRTSMFWLWYKDPFDPTSQYSLVPYVFAIRNGKELDSYVGLRFIAPSKAKWQFKLEPIVDLAAELRTHNDGNDMPMIYLRTAGTKGSIAGKQITFGNGFSFVYKGRDPVNTIRRRPPLNRTPKFVDEWGLFSLRSDTQISFSFESGAEIALVAVTEQQKQALTPSIYDGMAMLGLNIYSGQGVRDLRSLSAWVNKGKKVRKFLDTEGNYGDAVESTSYAPEIFLDTILDKENGIAAYANENGIDKKQLSISQRFCEENELFMDGVIADPTSWREFWAQTAPFSLLEFARIGGKETLIPAVPYDPLYRISRAIQISALFNQGNILEDSYKEEFLDYGDNTQDLIATIVYRNTADDNVFPQNTSLQIMRADAIEADSIRQTFDLSTFVSSREQAIKYGKLLCQQRRFSRRAIEFKTFPTESPVAPGSYIYVQLGRDQWDDIRSGVIEEGGKLNIPLVEDAINGSYTILLYNGQDSPTKLSSVSIVDNQSSALINYEGWLFVLGIPSEVKRVFRVTDVSMEEEGEITISAIEHPCEEVGGATLSKIANFDDAFLID